jgi:peptidoglycan LD-endopeptidase LytH
LALFVHNCVRFVPADQPAPETTSAARTSIFAPHGNALVVPVVNVRRADLVDTFTQSRGQGRPHDAIDILAPRGTPVLAAAAGTIEKLFLSKPGGKTIYVRSPDRSRIYYYAHLDSYRAGLSENQPVSPGDLLGTVGSTGNADPSAPHLHFAVHEMRIDEKWYQGRPINPYPLLVATKP